jgi:hypothetical protein
MEKFDFFRISPKTVSPPWSRSFIQNLIMHEDNKKKSLSL